MKKYIIFLIILLIFPIISAVQIDLNSKYSQGETLIAEISGNIVNKITEDNVYFYRQHINIPMEFEILKIQDNYYIYTKLNKKPDNYSVTIKNVEYYIEGGQTSTKEFSADFQILEGYADFSISPGALISEQPFSIHVQNLQANEIKIYLGKVYSKDEQTNESTNETQKEKSFFEKLFGGNDEEETSEENETITYEFISLKEGEIKNIPFEFKDLSLPTLTFIELSTKNTYYNIPVYILESPKEIPEEDFSFKSELFNISLEYDSFKTEKIILKNNLNKNLDINLSLSSNLESYLSIPKKIILKNNSEKEIQLNITSQNETTNLQGEIIAESSNFSSSSLVYLNIIEELPRESQNKKELPSVSKTCEQLNGTICKENQKCSGKQATSKDKGLCCIGTCENKKSNSTGKIIGWSIIIILVGIYIWFYLKKYKRTKRNINLIERGEKGISKTKQK